METKKATVIKHDNGYWYIFDTELCRKVGRFYDHEIDAKVNANSLGYIVS